METVPKEYEDKFFFHFTHIENIPNIIKNGLLSTNLKEKQNVKHVDIACKEIQNTRHDMKIPNCSLNSTIHDYVPFYFCARTPMLLSLLHSKNIDQDLMIYICISIKKLESENNIFTDESANRMTLPTFYTNPNDLSKLSWETIESKKWGIPNEDYKHKRMAEALIYQKLEVQDIDYIVVWSEDIKIALESEFKKNKIICPPIKYDGENGYYHYYDGFNIGFKDISLISGPKQKLSEFKNIYKNILEKRKKKIRYNFEDIDDLLVQLSNDFKIIKELDDISDLKTDNQEHSENVDNHTLSVVQNLEKLNTYNFETLKVEKKFIDFPKHQQSILKISAYFHDIGKGPKSRWESCNNGIQKVDHDHPRRSMNILERILIEEIKTLSEKDIYQILFLVGYHDFLGDHLTKGRKIDEILPFLKKYDENLNNLFFLSIADVLSIKPKEWYYDKQDQWNELYTTILKDISL